ncbi:MAG: hypothetical protein J6P98_00730 [Clostridia bacterium]|nr:hypothetical protein [Clostridia bacterium]
MKKFLVMALAALIALGALAVGCSKEPEYVPEGPTEVDYGTVSYIPFEDGGALTFDYLDCFTAAGEDQENFVGSTPDQKGVIAFEFFDSFKDYEHTTEYYRVPSRKYAEILAMTDEEAQNYMRIALGMVESQGAKYEIEAFSFEKFDHYLRLYIEATGEYETTGEVQKLWLEKYVVDNERVYTVQAFVPASCVTKYGPVFKNVAFDLEYALTEGVPED